LDVERGEIYSIMFLIFDGVYCEVRYVYWQVMFWMLAYGLKKMQDLK
jgi:hypothetical protein